MQNTFSQSGNDSKWFLKKTIFQNRYVELETPPPFMEKTILNFHFDDLNTCLSSLLALELIKIIKLIKTFSFCQSCPQFITILHGGVLFQYYSSERKMECYNPFSALNKVKSHHFILLNLNLWLCILSRNMKNVVMSRDPELVLRNIWTAPIVF